ncbi:MAG: BF3164 family lipoprotein [Bacteroidales bacterium]|nr:BF3164 family lipoprotein [Bacteroidales bacterium]
MNNNSIIGSTTSGNYRAFLFDIGKGDIVKTVDDIFFEQRSEKNRGHLGQIFYAENDYNFEHECFVSALRMFHRVDLYNSDLSLRFSIINENEFDPVLSNDPNRYLTDATMFHYVDVYTTSKYIFALYCGKDFKSATPGIGNEMHVFSWDGDALAKIFLDIGLSRFIITDKKIVGINWYENQPIVVYNLPDLSG